MSKDTYKVQELSPQEALEVLAKFNRPMPYEALPIHERPYLGRFSSESHRRVVFEGIELKGAFELTARDVESGDVAWKHQQDNLITDWGRCGFFDNAWNSMGIGFCPSKETPLTNRTSVLTDGNPALGYPNGPTVYSGGISPSITPSTNTRQYATTFPAPNANRTLGTIWLGYTSGGGVDQNFGVYQINSYALLTPAKTQTTTQTLEVVYKISMNPIF